MNLLFIIFILFLAVSFTVCLILVLLIADLGIELKAIKSKEPENVQTWTYKYNEKTGCNEIISLI